jgi:hypothetical protein
MEIRGRTQRVKIADSTKPSFYKSIIDEKLSEVFSDINKEDFIRIFSEMINDEEDKEDFVKYAETLNETFFQKLIKRIKSHHRITNANISKLIDEEKCGKESETKVVTEPNSSELRKCMEESITQFKKTLTKYYDTKNKVESCYVDKLNKIFQTNKYLLIRFLS